MTAKRSTDAVTRGDAPSCLDAIAGPEAALAIWNRALPDNLCAGLAALDLDTVDDLTLILDASAPVAEDLRGAGYPDAVAMPLAVDIARLIHGHARLTGERQMKLRLDVVETDACRRFHADYVTLRMLCTYVGPGTQWHRTEAANTIATVPTGAVAVFKGRVLLDPPAILHRSPPIMATGDRRLMIVIDPVYPGDPR